MKKNQSWRNRLHVRDAYKIEHEILASLLLHLQSLGSFSFLGRGHQVREQDLLQNLLTPAEMFPFRLQDIWQPARQRLAVLDDP